MVGINGHPQYFGNALDLYRRILFDNRSQADRVRTELLGDPQELRNQKPLYKTHVPESLRKRPHIWRDLRGKPIHTMLAEFFGHTVEGLPDRVTTDQPYSGVICVIVTLMSQDGEIDITVWQWQRYFALLEGMTFNLLDRMDGNVPAVVSGGVLRIDPSGVLADAPENIHNIWGQAETAFFERTMHMNMRQRQIYLDWDQKRLSDWWTQRRQLQERQQEYYHRMLARQDPQATPPSVDQIALSASQEAGVAQLTLV